MEYVAIKKDDDELMHYGVLGMKWGVRRYQNNDGSLTKAGRKRANKDVQRNNKWVQSKFQPSSSKSSFLAGLYAATGSKRIEKKLDKSNDSDRQRWENAQKLYDYMHNTKARDLSEKENIRVAESYIDDYIQSYSQSKKFQ